MTDTELTAAASIACALIAAYAAVKSSKAERNSRPVSNGFASTVIGELGHIREDLREIRQQMRDEWSDHYNNHHR